MFPSWQDPHVNMDLGRVVIPAGLQPGDTIKTWSTPFGRSGNAVWCDRDGGYLNADVVQGQAVPGFSKVYTTGVAGVGIRMTTASTFGTGSLVYPGRTFLALNQYYTFNDRTLTVELIKTAPVTGSGPLVAGQYSSFYLPTDPGHPVMTSWVQGNAITIVSPSCEIDAGSKNIAVNFGSVPLGSFGGVGTTAASRPFTINLQCQQSPGSVLVRLDGTTDPSNSPGVLQITQGAQSARGVGIQVLDRNNQPVVYGSNMNAGSSPSGPSTLQVPFTARYYQTGGVITPGEANSLATFTIQYQ
jgi:type 1 fimbria pilin